MGCTAHGLGRHGLFTVERHPLRDNEEVVVRPLALRPVNGQLHHRRRRAARLQLPVVLVAALEDKARLLASTGTGYKVPRNFPAAVAGLREVKIAVLALGALVGDVRLEFSLDRVAAGPNPGPLPLDARAAHERVAVLGFVERDCEAKCVEKNHKKIGGVRAGGGGKSA